MDKQQKNFLLACVLSFAMIFGWEFFFPKKSEEGTVKTSQIVAPVRTPHLPKDLLVPKEGKEDPFVSLASPKLEARVYLKGGFLQDITLRGERHSQGISLLKGKLHGSKVWFGWRDGSRFDPELKPGELDLDLPGEETPWKISASSKNSVAMEWTNSQGVKFRQTFRLEGDYLFVLETEVANERGRSVHLLPYGGMSYEGGLVTSEHSQAPGKGLYKSVVYDGALALGDRGMRYFSKGKECPPQGAQELYEYFGPFKMGSPSGEDLLSFKKAEDLVWSGATEQYWMMAWTGQEKSQTGVAQWRNGSSPIEQVVSKFPRFTLSPGQTSAKTYQIFAGPKQLEILQTYERDYKFVGLEKSLDFGWFSWITKPLMYVLNTIYHQVGSFPWAIVIVTIFLKVLFLPLGLKSFRAMERTKALKPKIDRIKAKYKDDKVQMNQKVIELYRAEKVNPGGGFLSILMQIPVFFGFYKVLFLSVDMHQAPFLWVPDLTRPDPCWLATGFGLWSWDVPGFLRIGIWPLLMGLSMYWQQAVTSGPQQDKIMRYGMPLIFTFFFGNMPVGLILYWTLSNFFGVIQHKVFKTFTKGN